MNNYFIFFSLLLAASFGITTRVQAAPNYVASVIEFGEEVQAVNVADLNGDGLEDLIVSNWNEDLGRELWLYWQQAGGKFPAKPSRRIDVKRDIVAYAMADIRPEPGTELLFFTALAIFSYSATHDTYAGNLEKVADWIFVSAVPSQRSTPFLGKYDDSDGDGNIDLLIPGEETFGVASIIAKKSEQQNLKLTHLPVAQQRQQGADSEGGINVNLQDGVKIEVSRPSYFEGLVVERLAPPEPKPEDDRFARYESPGTLLNLERWINNVTAVQLDDDAALEYIYLDEDPEADHDDQQQRLNIVNINASGEATITFQTQLDKRDQIKLFDVNDDGLQDLLTMRQQGADDVTANFYLNRAGKFDLERADQVIKVSGYDVNFRLSDIDGDGRSDLIVGAYQISALDALREGALLRLALIYRGNANVSDGGEQPLFNRRPDFKLEENFSADDIRGLTQPVDFTLDLDGDGNKDAIALDKRGALIARPMNKQLQLQNQASWEFVPLRFVQSVANHQLNSDQRPDFVLRHEDGVTVLVSQ